MKKLILLRHAKSSWNDTSLRDHDRPLTERGIEDAILIGKYLNNINIFPDLIISSTSKRTKMTINLVLNEFSTNIDIKYNNDLYLNSANKVLDIISKTNDLVNTLLIVGHNPYTETLANKLSKTGFHYSKYNTAGLALLEINIESWQDIKNSKGTLKFYIKPKILKANQ